MKRPTFPFALALIVACAGNPKPKTFGSASNLTPTGIGQWAESDFTRAMRQGKRPDGSTIDPFMPWEVFRKMSNDDLHTLWLYLRSVPAKEFGNK